MQQPSTRSVGASAEARAVAFLEARGFRILVRNYHCKGGELDVVADDAGTIVFVEIRARASDAHGDPVETVGGLKRHRVVHAARVYLHTDGAAHRERACRFDVVTLLGDAITHYEDAFDEGTW